VFLRQKSERKISLIATLYTPSIQIIIPVSFLRAFFQNPSRIAIAFLAILCLGMAAGACTQAPATQPAGPVSIAGGWSGSLHIQSIISKDTCTREGMDRCEYSCMMPGGVLDLNCYEDCIYSIC